MNFLTLENISKSYADRALIENLSLSINKGEKVALVAKNGTGKTTLLRIAAGIESVDDGKTYLRKEIRTAFLEQEPALSHGKNVLEAVFDTDHPMLLAVKEYERCLLHPEKKKEFDAAMEKMELLKAWDYEAQVKQILSRLNITQLEQPVSTLSGGQKKRVALAKLLIDDPDFLILDEPTNHLDLEMIEWLEKYLSKPSLTLLMVTHDRFFLDNVCNEIIELDDQHLYRYKGNYSYYLEKKAQGEAAEEASVDRARNLLRKELDWMRRQPKARTTKAKSRMDAFYDLKERAASKTEEDELKLEIHIQRLGGKIVEFHHVHKSYGHQKLLRDFTYKFKSRERVGIVGRNGSGKSTLLRLMTGREKPDSGKIVMGDTVQFGYYSQEGIQLKEDKRVIEAVREIADFIPLIKGKTISASQLLERFLFPQSSHYTYVSKLSGGEKRRLFLLTILMKNPNFLILDEPTNDLDIITLNVLEDFLLDFPGCLAVVSHDRHFMNKLVDHLLVLEGDGMVKDFPGNYHEYIAWKESETPKVTVEKKEETPRQKPKEKRRLSYLEKREFESLEKEIRQLEQRKIELTEAMSAGDADFAAIQKFSSELSDVMKQLESKSDRWLELSEFS
jgi:ATP-binding cassette subfamily F protein uup